MNFMVIAGLLTAAAAVIGDAVVDYDNATRRARAAGSASRTVLVEAAWGLHPERRVSSLWSDDDDLLELVQPDAGQARSGTGCIWCRCGHDARHR
jgi:hypothetical protein